MKRRVIGVLFGASLVVLSGALYLVHYEIFRDARHIFIYLLGDIAFLPIEVLIVTVIIHRLLTEREKRARLKKLNMVIGAFFSEVGTGFMKLASQADPESGEISARLLVKGDWTARQFREAARDILGKERTMTSPPGMLAELKGYLLERRRFLLGLLENPNLLEHESFTEVLWALFHLTEELAHRTDLAGTPETDRKHLMGDLERAYGRVISEWLTYMEHLRGNYPYLFSLAVRTNPFDAKASVVVR